MISPTRKSQVLWVAVAAALLACAASLQRPLDRQCRELELTPADSGMLANHPEYALLQIAPGGLRAPLVAYLWTRLDQLKEEGQYYEAMQLAELICNLQQRFPGVWGFQAWNMAYNISAEVHSPQERWRWVNKGIELLRDRGIVLNPKSLDLYLELARIYSMKISGFMDDAQQHYKAYVAAQMQHLLGAPPVGETKETIDAFAPIAEAPLDKDPTRQARDTIQADRLAWMIDPDAARRDPRAQGVYDAGVAAYLGKLRALGIQADQGLLDAYNRFSEDFAAASVRLDLPIVQGDQRWQQLSERDRQVLALINDPAFAKSRGKLLAFVRAQMLWNYYRMDPQWMLAMMQRYGPLDWRHASCHTLYWVTYGLHVCQGATWENMLAIDAKDINSINLDRTLVTSLNELTWRGRLQYHENPRDPEQPSVTEWVDLRFVSISERERFRLENELIKLGEIKNPNDAGNFFRDSHINYSTSAIGMLWAMDRRKDAQDVMDGIRKYYDLKGPDWDMTLEQFVQDRLTRDYRFSQNTSFNQCGAAIISSFTRLIVNDRDGSQAFYNYATDVWRAWQSRAAARNKYGNLYTYATAIVQGLLTEPEIYGLRIDLQDRATTYRSLDSLRQKILYDDLKQRLEPQCARQNIDFAKAFPEPDGMPEFRRQREREAPLPLNVVR